MQASHTTRPYNNDIKIIYDILKALPFKKCVKSTDFKLCLKIFSDLDSVCVRATYKHINRPKL